MRLPSSDHQENNREETHHDLTQKTLEHFRGHHDPKTFSEVVTDALEIGPYAPFPAGYLVTLSRLSVY